METLSDLDLTGIDMKARDTDGNSPSDCFYKIRSSTCTLVRESFEEEEQAWLNLLRSACRQNDVDTYETDHDSESEGDYESALEDGDTGT